jgi:hypothetical protein
MDEIRGVVNGLSAAKPNRLSKWVLLAYCHSRRGSAALSVLFLIFFRWSHGLAEIIRRQPFRCAPAGRPIANPRLNK